MIVAESAHIPRLAKDECRAVADAIEFYGQHLQSQKNMPWEQFGNVVDFQNHVSAIEAKLKRLRYSYAYFKKAAK